MHFYVGQRYTSHSEPNLGLGIVTELDGRQVIISFPAAGETRAYASQNAPLSRIQYQSGDAIQTIEQGTFVVRKVLQKDQVFYYEAETQDGLVVEIPEWQLDPFVNFTGPYERLKSGQLTHPLDYRLRVETLCHQDIRSQAHTKGLLGGRVQLLPHQIYIAHEVAKRRAPRVLLSDEVGLGKTIEAGMILHHQLLWGSARRVLIIVPEPLLHQWLVEMLRRFNLTFSIFDQDRYNSLLVDEEAGNPFEAEQQVLCTLEFLTQTPGAMDHIISAPWDLLVVDEAHHINGPSARGHASEETLNAYNLVKQLSQTTQSVLLVTATPEQAGTEAHFERLQLLDPDRYHRIEAFHKEESQYAQVRTLMSLLSSEAGFNTANITTEQMNLLKASAIDPNALEDPDQRTQAISKLLDTQGTGKGLFRNSRKNIPGFPTREVQCYPLTLPPAYQDQGVTNTQPEAAHPDESWTEFDPRVHWLTGWLKGHKQQKFLLICHHKHTAEQLDKFLNLKAGIRSTAFYEGLSIVERDRAAAYFADPESGAQILVCSEVGSEGRNFQFLQDLILFDLPEHPDLLEQRIGRLDRIGQQDRIRIHIPFFEHTAQSVLMHWYQAGLNQFQQSFSAGHKARQQLAPQLEAALAQPQDQSLLNILIAQSIETRTKLTQTQEAGRDALLEHNSCRTEIATPLIEEIIEEESSSNLQDYLQQCFDRLGINCEDHSEHTWVISAGEDSQIEHIPGFNPDGMTVTLARNIALEREDFHFLTWEHPIVRGIMERIQETEFGNASVAAIPIKKLPAGALFLEVWFCIQASAPSKMALERFLPITPTRFLMDANGSDLSQAMSFENLAALCSTIKKEVAIALVRRAQDTIKIMLDAAQDKMQLKLETIKTQAKQKMQQEQTNAIARLKALQHLNPDIKTADIDHLSEQTKVLADAIERATLSLEALKLMINTG